jgi:hypothetical protein
MKKILIGLLSLSLINGYAQQTFKVTDSMPAENEGLRAGYDITGASEKEVGNKGDFSRYKLRFYVTNTSTQAKLILYRPGGINFGNSVSPNLTQFKCLNATGARLTNKEVTLDAKQCIIDAMVDETDPAGKTVQRKKPASIGYWIKPGETISSNTIVIVPLNEKPNVTVTFFPNTGSMGATVINNSNNYTNNSNAPNYANNNNSVNAQTVSQGFVRIKNFASNNYLHNQNGPVACTAIDHEWGSAQWEMLPVNGTSYYQIRNRWKNNFISTENNSLLSDNGKSSNAMWLIEETSTSNIYTIKNAATNAKLSFQDGALKTSSSFGNQPSMQWIIEQ